jgi:hypothetical protein
VKVKAGGSCELRADQEALTPDSDKLIGPNPFPFVVLHHLAAPTSPKVAQATRDAGVVPHSLSDLNGDYCGC